MAGSDKLALLILAAGKGTRMRSRLPKVLHPVCGRAIVLHALALGRELGAERTLVVVGDGDDEVSQALAAEGAETVVQAEQLGTGHAVLQAREKLKDHQGPILIMYGDHPLYRASTFQNLLDTHAAGASLTLLTGEFPQPAAYGRIVRGPDGRIDRIVEARDASPEVLAITEINLGVYVAGAPLLFDTLAKIESQNDQGEYYLTDIVELALEAGQRVESCKVEDWTEAIGVNDRADLAQAERILRKRIIERWMREGVSFIDPDHSYVDAEVQIGPDTQIEPGCRLRGKTRVGSGCRLEPNVVLDDSTLGDDVWIKPHSWVEESQVGSGCIIGPSAHLRPGNRIGNNVRIGNFVEIKNSNLGDGTKADHLSYIGDADIGSRVTFACGAITVNYDGQKKSRTTVGDDSFIGCNANLIAPIEIEHDSYVAAGSTVTQKVPSEALAVGRAKQRNIEGWVRRRFGKKNKD